MDAYHHYVSGFFVQREEAEKTLSILVARGLPRERLRLFNADPASPAANPQAASNEVLKDVLIDGAIGTAVGTGFGALAELALVTANVSLFIASPLLAPLMMLGWGASLGALVGASAGASAADRHKDGRFADLIRDALAGGQVVLVAETRSAAETAMAREVIGTSVGARNIATG